MRRDHRYSIKREMCGRAEPRFVVRFCGEWVGQAHSLQDAMQIELDHKQQRENQYEQSNRETDA